MEESLELYFWLHDKGMWLIYTIINGKPGHLHKQESVERGNLEFKKVLAALMRYFVVTNGFPLHNIIDTNMHSTLDNSSPNRVLFGREPQMARVSSAVIGFLQFASWSLPFSENFKTHNVLTLSFSPLPTSISISTP